MATGHEFINEIEKIKKYMVNSDFIAGYINAYTVQRFDLNNFQVEGEEFCSSKMTMEKEKEKTTWRLMENTNID